MNKKYKFLNKKGKNYKIGKLTNDRVNKFNIFKFNII